MQHNRMGCLLCVLFVLKHGRICFNHCNCTQQTHTHTHTHIHRPISLSVDANNSTAKSIKADAIRSRSRTIGINVNRTKYFDFKQCITQSTTLSWPPCNLCQGHQNLKGQVRRLTRPWPKMALRLGPSLCEGLTSLKKLTNGTFVHLSLIHI